MSHQDEERFAADSDRPEERGPVVAGGVSGFLNYYYWIRLAADEMSSEFVISPNTPIAVRTIFVEAFMDIGGGGFPASVPTASLMPRQYDTEFPNPTIPLPMTKVGLIPNKVLPTPPDLVDHYRGVVETYFHLDKGRGLILTFKRNAGGVRYSLLKVNFTVETW